MTKSTESKRIRPAAAPRKNRPKGGTRSLKKGIEILKKGGLIAFPTETVYGLGAKAFNAAAVLKIFAAKGRPADNPLIVHIASPDQLDQVADQIPPVAQKLVEAFWPGPLTLILKRSPKVPSIVSAGLETVAVRCPDHPIALALIRGVGEPVAAPSANRSGRPSPTRAEHVIQDLGARVDGVVDGGPCTVGVESTVVDLIQDPPCILRPGVITVEALRKAIGGPVASGPLHPAAAGRSPGMKHRHYAPRFDMMLVPPSKWDAALAKGERSGRRFGILSRKNLSSRERAVYQRRIGGGVSGYARALFAALLEAEGSAVELLFIETVPKKGVGVAVMDRLERAARGKASEEPSESNQKFRRKQRGKGDV